MTEPSSAAPGEPLATVIDVWREVLDVSDVDEATNFFRSGGNSIKSAVLVGKLRAATGTRVSVRDFLRDPTPRAVARLVAGGTQPVVPTTGGPDNDVSVTSVADVLGNAVAAGHNLGAQAYAARRGQVLVDVAVGGDAARPITTTSTFRWFRAGGSIMGLVFATLVDAAGVTWSSPVATHVPELHDAPIAAATVAQLLQSVSGTVETVTRYSHHTGWQVLRTLVERVTDEPFERYAHRAVLDPLGLTSTTCEPIEAVPTAPNRVAQAVRTADGWIPATDTAIAPGTVGMTDDGHGFAGTARDLAVVLTEVRDACRGRGKLLTRTSGHDLVSMARGRGHDRRADHRLDIGLGVPLQMAGVLASTRCTEAAFGHLGVMEGPVALVLCEPDRDTVLAVLLRGDAPSNRILLVKVVDKILAMDPGGGEPG